MPPGLAVSKVSTNSRYPRAVGIRPALVCGLAISPSSSRSAMTLRIVAGLSSNPDAFDNVRDPTGEPSAMYRSTRAFSSVFARSSSMVFILKNPAAAPPPHPRSQHIAVV